MCVPRATNGYGVSEALVAPVLWCQYEAYEDSVKHQMTTNLQLPPRLLFPSVGVVPLAVLSPLEGRPQALEPPAPPPAAVAAAAALGSRPQEVLHLTKRKRLPAGLVSQLLVALPVVPLVEAPPSVCLD